MPTADLVQLEAAIKALPGVLGCVILSNADGNAYEIETFTEVGADREAVKQAVVERVAESQAGGAIRQVYVFELEAESHFGDRESLLRAAELAEQEARTRGSVEILEAAVDQLSEAAERGSPAVQPQQADRGERRADGGGSKVRPTIRRVVLSSTAWSSDAEVSIEGEQEVVGQASADKSPHGLKVLALATLEALGQLYPDLNFDLKGASLVDVLGQEAVMVLVGEGETDMVGSALVHDGSVSEVAVRATLDAVNRRLALA